TGRPRPDGNPRPAGRGVMKLRNVVGTVRKSEISFRNSQSGKRLKPRRLVSNGKTAEPFSSALNNVRAEPPKLTDVCHSHRSRGLTPHSFVRWRVSARTLRCVCITPL